MRPSTARTSSLWLVTGEEKAGPLRLLESGDGSIPAGRVRNAHSLILADRSAAARS